MRRAPIVTILLFLALLPVSDDAGAGKVYTFRDASGRVLFTNVVTGSMQPAGEKFRRYSTLEKVTFYKDTNVHRYRNWGSDQSAVLPSFSKNRNAFDHLIRTAADREGVSRGLVKAIIHTESGFNPKALSKPGAQGLMQLMPATADRYDVTDVFDPGQNINAGVRHIRYLLGRYDNDLTLTLAAYNAGERNVEKYNGVPPFPETQDYVRRVMSRYQALYKNTL
jgi:soluble lytic murein transglycosylase-like protein